MLDFNLLFDSWKSAYYIRYVEQLLSSIYSDNNIRCPTHLSVGQEMVPSILSRYLHFSDKAVSSHRSHAHYLSKGGSLSSFFDELHGLATGCSGGKGGSMHLADPSVGFVASTAIVGNTIPVGVGLACSIKLSNSNDISVIYLGDGATEEGVFWESLHYSISQDLPCLFVIENNQFSVYTNLHDRQKNTSLHKKLLGFTDNIYRSSEHDFLAFHDICQSAVDLVRTGKTSVIFAETFRYLEHCGPSSDDHLAYRDESYLDHWKSLDILALMETFLVNNGLSNKLDSKKPLIQSFCDDAFRLSLSKRRSFLQNQNYHD